MHSDICCGLYRGEIYLQNKRIPNAPLLSVGNAEFTINMETTDIEQANFTSLGGNACKVSYINSMQLALTLHCTSPENLALAFLGEATQLDGGFVEDEEHDVHSVGELIPFENVADKAMSIVVKSENGVTTFVENEDYAVTNAGIKILNSSMINSTIKVTYYYGKNYRLEALTMSQQDFYVVFDGVNVGEGGEVPVVMKFYKVKFSPTDSFAVISGDAFASLALNGEVLKDSSIVGGNDLSKFLSIEWGQAYSGPY